MLKPLFSVFLVLLSFFPRLVTAGEFQDDLKARRARAMERLGPESMLILWSAPTRVYSRDVDYEYRQDSNLYYLTGIDQEDTTLVLMPGNLTHKEILFVRPWDPVREHWQGRVLTKDEATARSGIATVYLQNDFEPFVEAMFSRSPRRFSRDASASEYETFFKAFERGEAQLALVSLPKPGLAEALGPNLEFANRLKERFVGFALRDATKT